jgi:hypothetical protein
VMVNIIFFSGDLLLKPEKKRKIIFVIMISQ